MDKRNKTALAYLLIGVAAAGRALLSVPENAAIQEVSLTVLALNSCPHSSSVTALTLRVDTPCTYISAKADTNACSLR